MVDQVVLLVGTRPEAVKIAPVALALAGHSHLRPLIVHSGQHQSMVAQALEPFGLTADIEFPMERRTGSQAELAAALLPALDDLLVLRRPKAVLVQGDTSTTVVGALAAFWRDVPVAHLEAGLRTGDLDKPFPEEGNRQLISRIASLHLAPTPVAAEALRREAPPRPRISVTGNTVVDAVQYIACADLPPRNAQLVDIEREVKAKGGRILLVTVHRRESWGAPLDRVLAAVREIVNRYEDCFVVLPAHPNPSVSEQVHSILAGHARIAITEPLDYPDLIRVLRCASLVITDSGGIQEEAPTFGVPVLVARDVTERLEAVHAGCAWLVGTDPTRIIAEADRLLGARLRLAPGTNPYGDGKASLRVVEELENLVRRRSTQLRFVRSGNGASVTAVD
ncbi:non-hydrolyzing UDP-N-acetylglucosamine 2-epimerase [Amycolatopsis anabasis]|uniref:non-hydrolyzing UDP-N-acetylglucosamine 2-epimerase n=1 Tax=Amycolatopsis anabasis TaxID=1840409 RepID=UPI00131BBE8C|nr:UDP-N-acetylglucosamine 2-epimerase (non-hydrolyzing) [Amycolatopsis anabasis]